MYEVELLSLQKLLPGVWYQMGRGKGNESFIMFLAQERGSVEYKQVTLEWYNGQPRYSKERVGLFCTLYVSVASQAQAEKCVEIEQAQTNKYSVLCASVC